MIMGKGKNTKAFFELEEKVPLHHSLKSIQSTVETLTKEINMLAENAKNQLNERNELKKDKLNKTKIVKKFNKGDIVYALDRYTLPGNTRPLKSKYYPSPCIVLQDRYTTTLIQRIADGFKSLYSHNDIKKFKDTDSIFVTLPKTIQKVLLYNFKDLLDDDLKTIAKHDHLNIPEGIELFDTVDNTKAETSFLPFKGEGTATALASHPDENVRPPTKKENVEKEEEESDNSEEEENSDTEDGIKLRSGKIAKKVTFKK